MAGLQCPKCGLFSPASAAICDCGHEFVAAAAKARRELVTRQAGPLTANDIDGVLKRLPGGSAFLGRREVKELPSILWEDEVIHHIVQGMYSGGNGILVCTQRRLVFVDKGMFGSLKVEDFPLDKISSIQYSTGLLLGTITIFTSGNKAEISHVGKAEARSFAEGARALIAKGAVKPVVQAPSAQAATPAGSNLAADLERLAALRTSGVLSEDEFAAAKRTLLN